MRHSQILLLLILLLTALLILLLASMGNHAWAIIAVEWDVLWAEFALR